jgi:hypothetical protein
MPVVFLVAATLDLRTEKKEEKKRSCLYIWNNKILGVFPVSIV